MYWLLTVAAIIAALHYAARWLRRGADRSRRSRDEAARAAATFRDGHETLSFELARSTQLARLTDKPPVIALDAANGELLALAEVHGDAPSTAVFAWRRDRWRCDGRVVAGLTPAETLRRNRRRLIAA